MRIKRKTRRYTRGWGHIYALDYRLSHTILRDVLLKHLWLCVPRREYTPPPHGRLLLSSMPDGLPLRVQQAVTDFVDEIMRRDGVEALNIHCWPGRRVIIGISPKTSPA